MCLADEPQLAGTVQPFFAKNYNACHNAKPKIGGLNLEAFNNTPPSVQDRDAFEKILRRLEAGEMPPKGQPRPSEAELSTVTKWIQTRYGLAARATMPSTIGYSGGPAKVRA